MLRKNPEDRITLQEIKKHPWMAPSVKQPMSPLKTTVGKVKQAARASLSPMPRRRARASVA